MEPGQETLLDEPAATITVKALLKIDPATVLNDYELALNPYHDMSFIGKFLEPEIGLVYFGGRWYEPGIGRWLTVDPAEDGGNWYGYCDENPINYKDRDGLYTGADDLGAFLGGGIAGAGIEYVSQLWHHEYDGGSPIIRGN